MGVLEAEHVKALEDSKAEHAKARKISDNEHAEAQAINDELMKQLERRKQTIDEAVTIICQLEEKIEKLESTSTLITSSMGVQHIQPQAVPSEDTPPHLESTASELILRTPGLYPIYRETTSSAIPSSDCLQMSVKTVSMLHKSPLLKTAFLKADNGSAGTLRSMYLEGEKKPQESPKAASPTRPLSLLSRDEDGEYTNPEDYYRMRTPPLSILSKGSFQSIYGTPEGPVIGLPNVSSDDPDIQPRSVTQNCDADPLPEGRQASRIRKWMDDKESPLKSRHISPRRGVTEPILSIGSLLKREEITNELSHSRATEIAEPQNVVTVRLSPGTMSITKESLRDGSLTLAPSHLAQKEFPRSPSADSDASELARIVVSMGPPGWLGSPHLYPSEKSISIEEESSLYQNNDQNSPELSALRTENVAEKIQDKPFATIKPVPHVNNMMFDSDNYPPKEYRTQLLYKDYPPHSESPPHTTGNVSRLPKSEISPSGRVTRAESPRVRGLEQTPSPLKLSQDMQELENPEAQHYQRLVTPPSDAKTTRSCADSESKLPRLSSSRTTSSSLSVTPLLPARPKFTSRLFPRSQSQSIKVHNTQQVNSPLTQRQSLDAKKQRTGSSTTMPKLLPRAPRTPLLQRAPISRIARPRTKGSAQSQRATSSVITRRETHAISTGTTSSGEEGFLTPSTNSHNDSAAETPPYTGRCQVLQKKGDESNTSSTAVVNEGIQARKWGKALGRTTSLKFKQSFGWKKGEN